jgi:CRP-like cAMP-binding protein
VRERLRRWYNCTLTRKDLAELTGMSPESITRITTRFKNEGIIKVSGKNYEILDIGLLKKISDLG